MKILVVNPFGIGDVLFTTPLIHSIKQNVPNVFIGYWCNERVSPILENNLYIDKIINASRGDIKRISKESKIKALKVFFSILGKIKKEKFDLAIDLSLDHRYSLILKILGVKRRIGYDYKNRGRFLTEKITLDTYKNKHIIEYYNELLKFLNIQANIEKMDLFIDNKDRNWADNFFRENNIKDLDYLIAVAPGAGGSWGKEASLKHWPLEYFAKLINLLIEKNKTKIIILGDVNDQEICQKIKNLANFDIINVCGKTTLGQFASILAKSNMLITNDGGPLHMAVALGIKTVSIFGPVSELVYGPYPPSQNHLVIKKDISCRPCYKNFRMPECKENRICVNDISPEEVYQEIKL